jgi:hypothetical protein
MGLTNQNSSNDISCPNDLISSVKSFVFGGDPTTPTMEIVQGAKTLLAVSLEDLFITLTKYQLQEFTIERSSTITLDGGNIASSLGEVQFLAIIPTYPSLNDADEQIDTGDLFINWEFPTGAGIRRIGKIMILTGSTLAGYGWDLDTSPGGLVLSNPHSDFTVDVKVLAFN